MKNLPYLTEMRHNKNNDNCISRRRTIMKYVAGIDGGETRTTVICSDRDGRVMASEEFGSFNIENIGVDGFTILMVQICEFLRQTGECEALCIGAGDVHNLRMQSVVKQAMERAGITNWQLVSNQKIALWGALAGEPGITVVVENGSICFGRNADNETARVGGWGHRIGDEGSGYAIGRDVLRAVAQAWDAGDASESATMLMQLLADKYKITNREKMIAYADTNDESGIAQLAGAAEQAAAAGDAKALAILTENASLLSEQAALVVKRLKMDAGEVALLGELLENDTMYRKLLVQEIEKRCIGFKCVKPCEDAAEGAVLMARQSVRSEE